MLNNTQDQEDLSIRVPITTAARQQAQAFAEEQSLPEKAEQVRRNTLAVLAVRDYLQWQNYETDLTTSDSWNQATRTCGDVADLMIAGFGRIECRPVDDLEEPCPIPPEIWHNRIGYVLVHLDEELREATLLGFVPPFDPEDPLEEILVTQLQSMDELIDYLYRLELAQQELNQDSAEAQQFREMWENPEERLMVIAQLERIYRCELPSKWRVKGEKVLSGRGLEGVAVREGAVAADRIQLQGVAERLLERLAAVWNGVEG
ncbi:DUF1822 family protein [Floridanema evergladense]|uniref:DUF1822 family protein n=1 Tax=Floridaenema evergladense BLCC-F167 TaxID=3153639 RepID=A0ABV4WQU5_9CYAN